MPHCIEGPPTKGVRGNRGGLLWGGFRELLVSVKDAVGLRRKGSLGISALGRSREQQRRWWSELYQPFDDYYGTGMLACLITKALIFSLANNTSIFRVL